MAKAKKILEKSSVELQPYQGELDNMVYLREQSADYERVSKEMKEAADEIFIGLKNLLAVDEILLPTGTYSWVEKVGTDSVDTAKLKTILMQKGINSDIITQAFAEATTRRKSSKYAMWRPKKGE